MYQYWLIGCNKCNKLVQDIINRGSWEEEGGVWNFILSAELSCKSNLLWKVSKVY